MFKIFGQKIINQVENPTETSAETPVETPVETSASVNDQEKMRNEDYLRRVFESGTQEELDKIIAYHNLSAEQIKLFCHFSKLRKEIVDEMRLESTDRKINNPVATAEELSLGAYQESIEPQVRETVNNLRKKGYPTYESGFSGFKDQLISFEEECLAGFNVPESLRVDLEKQGIEIEITTKSIRLILNKECDLKQLTEAWSKIEAALPDLGKPVASCQLAQAKMFRAQQESLDK